MMSVFEEMVEFLDSTYIAKDIVVPCMIGPVGIGKTAAVYQHAKNVKAGKVVTIIASQILPNEVSGITMPVNETKSMEIFDHYRLSNLEDGDILFFDELLEADQMVLSACLTLIESRQMMSGRKLPDIQIIAATNPTVSAMQIKQNIRQRFMWRMFYQDSYGCITYIEKKYGYKIPAGVIASDNESNRADFNFVTPRTLTKIVDWVSRIDNKVDLDKAVANICNMYGIQFEKILKDEWLRINKGSIALEKTRQALSDVLDKTYTQIGTEAQLQMDKAVQLVNKETFANDDVVSVVELLQQLDCWDDIQKQLEGISIE